jgi:hypothetical protein
VSNEAPLSARHGRGGNERRFGIGDECQELQASAAARAREDIEGEGTHQELGPWRLELGRGGTARHLRRGRRAQQRPVRCASARVLQMPALLPSRARRRDAGSAHIKIIEANRKSDCCHFSDLVRRRKYSAVGVAIEHRDPRGAARCRSDRFGEAAIDAPSPRLSGDIA